MTMGGGVTGVSHVTFSVADLERSFRFYVDVLGMRPVARWWRGAHLTAGTTWVCLNVESEAERRAAVLYDHVAFSVAREDFRAVVERLDVAGAARWQENRSEGESVYFLDPDGHRLELHVGDLRSRVEALRREPPRELEIFADGADARGRGYGAVGTRLPAASELQAVFGPIDIYLFDQLMRGRVPAGARVLDAGCGWGRNLVYLLREGYEVWGTDRSAEAIAEVSGMAREIAGDEAARRFRVETVERMSFADGFADVVISNAVLHFAESEEQWVAMVREMWRVLRVGGMLFARMGTTIGGSYESLGGRRFRLPGGTEWLLADAAMLERMVGEMGGELLDPVKTTVVEGQRSMTTWVVRKVR